MKVLIVENDPNLGRIWARSIKHSTTVVSSQDAAVAALQCGAFDIVILNLSLKLGSTLAVADFAGYRRPDAKVIYVTADSFFSDGSIFNLLGNACAMVPSGTTPSDMAAIVDHHCVSRAARAVHSSPALG